MVIITVEATCRDCNGVGYYCDYHCEARGVGKQCTHRVNNGCVCKAPSYGDYEERVQTYEVEIDDKVYAEINRQIDKKWSDSYE